MAQQPAPENFLVISYLGLRKAIGILGVALPFVLPFGQIFLHALGIQSSLHTPVIENSVSYYYHTDMRNIFVGSMCAIGVFLVRTADMTGGTQLPGVLRLSAPLAWRFSPPPHCRPHRRWQRRTKS